MPQNGLSLGVDYQIGLYDGFSKQILVLGDVQSFKATAHNTSIKSMPYNGAPRFAHVPDGFSGTFSIIRTNGTLEQIERQRAAAINAGTVMPTCFINKTVTNPDSTVTKTQYRNVDWFVTEENDISRDKAPSMTVEWHAADEVDMA